MIAMEQKLFDLRLPPAVPFTVIEELAIVEAAYSDRTATPKQRLRLALLLKTMDRADEAAEILENDALADDFHALTMRADVYLARRTPQDNALAHDLLIRAVESAGTSAEKAQALAELGRAAIHRNDQAGARSFLARALGHDPANADAFRRMAQLAMESDNPDEALAMADGMLAANVLHTWALSIRAAALAAMGRLEAAGSALGLDRFVKSGWLPAPDGWSSIAAFNRALAEELEAHPGLRYGRYGTAATESWRIDEPHIFNRSVLFGQLLALIRKEVQYYVQNLGGQEHPFLRSRPAIAELNSWAVIAGPQGYESWHNHPSGWLSGVYYVDVPPAIETANDPGGCLEFGMRPGRGIDTAGASALCRLVRPMPGFFTLFPSCNYHRTHPMNEAKRRICVAFDVVPVRTVPGP
jgi:hypothetical protein